jgi:alginate O-acetyltransferase complex protein AlgI
MLFNSSSFLLYFLPVVVIGFLVLTGLERRRWAGLWLTAASLFFYGFWDARYVPLLLASMLVNYAIGKRLSARPSRALLIAAVGANVALLGYFKYTDFFIETANVALGLELPLPHILLPLAISFFTFQQLAYLSDAYDGAAAEHDFANYCLFITFFPHLIAGPITHHREMLPQFNDPSNFRPRWDYCSIGATLFLVGLFKKVEIADRFGEVARPVFAAAATGEAQTLLDGWGGALAYALQIYFDFSGYTDMAIGLGLVFCIRLPQNFNSPYKARNISEFWSRWHMTLTRFLTGYVFNPLALWVARSRAARGLPQPRRGRMTAGAWLGVVAFPTMTTMFISGFWHGAGWTFIAFGVLHGLYLCVHSLWQVAVTRFKWQALSDRPLVHGLSVLLTFVSVVVGLVFFRASSIDAALQLLRSMVGASGVVIAPALLSLPGLGLAAGALGLSVAPLAHMTVTALAWVLFGLALVWTLPNAQQWLRLYPTALQSEPQSSWLQRRVSALTWRAGLAAGVSIGWIGFFIVMRAASAAPTEFLYFQF